MLCSRCLPIAAAMAALAGPVGADVLYVDDDALPGGDGLSWDTAYTYLQTALSDAATSGGTVTEIRVAQGTYRPDQYTPEPAPTCCVVHDGPGCDVPACEESVCFYYPFCCDTTWDAACVALADLFCGDLCEEPPTPPATFSLLNGVSLLGGFAGLGAPDPDARDIDAYPSILDGDVDGDDGLNPGACCAPHEGPGCDDPSPDGECEAAVCAALPYCCETTWDVLCAALARSPTFCDAEATCPEIYNDLQIVTGSGTDGTAVLDGFTVTRGSPGVYMYLGGTPTIRHCTFAGNRIGVKCDTYPGGPTVQDCAFVGNGVGMSSLANGAPTVTNCTFSGHMGRGLWASGGTVTDCIFTGNASTSAAALEMGNGTVVGCTVSENRAFFVGGGMSLGGEAAAIDCTLTGNEAGLWGGGLDLGSKAAVIGCTFANNTAVEQGGGVCVEYFSLYDAPRIVNSLFVGNSAERGGGLYCQEPVELINCTLTGNTASSGGAMWVYDGAGVVNCVLWDNEPDEIARGGPTLTVRFSDVQGGFPGDGNIDADPRFVDPDAGDFRLGTGSACIDAGQSQMPATLQWHIGMCDVWDLDGDGDTVELIPIDLEGRLRFADDPATADTGCGASAVVDMGAFEFGAPQEGQRVVYADLDGDGEVTVTDFLLLLEAWGPCGEPCCLGDFGAIYEEDCRVLRPPDGVVDGWDAGALIYMWFGL